MSQIILLQCFSKILLIRVQIKEWKTSVTKTTHCRTYIFGWRDLSRKCICCGVCGAWPYSYITPLYLKIHQLISSHVKTSNSPKQSAKSES